MRVRAAAEIEAEKVRAIADVRAEVADLALLAASKRRRRDDDRRSPASPRGRVPQQLRHRATRRTDGASAIRPHVGTRRRPSRSPSVTARSTPGVASSTPPRPSSVTAAIGRTLSNPAIALETAGGGGRGATFGTVASQPVTQPHPAHAPAGPDRGRAARGLRVPPPRQRPPGHHHRHRHGAPLH